MPAYLTFPDLDPAIFSVTLFGTTLSLRWYALAYIVGLILGWRAMVWMMRRPRLWPADRPPMSAQGPEDLLTYAILGVVLGGRIGYVLFYAPAMIVNDPLAILRIWDGGMSFHGGFLGVILAVILFCRRTGAPLLQVADAVACATPFGLMLGRLANFVNGELWGRPTTVSWGMVFPDERAQICPPGWAEPVCARHPSQLYEAALEGLVLLVLLWALVLFAGWLKKPGRLTGMFFVGYGLARSLIENFRQGDAQFVTADNPWGHILRFDTGPEAWGLTMGQILSLPMILVGIGFFIWSARARAQGA
ncbi:MAG: prolipoprotein diacylglyceryl transferase [Alphaproteobacteria bacterium]|nr:MAG: prolipoprotein diacylglyceryl transferase [Alphaproteobacteria bacterium]